jgi:transcriptional regulator with XRE-family HTH domain
MGSNVPLMETRASSAGPFDRAVAAALRSATAERFLTQVEVAEKTGIPVRTLARYYKGTSPVPIGKLVDIASALGVQPSEIVESAQVIARRAEQNRRG